MIQTRLWSPIGRTIAALATCLALAALTSGCASKLAGERASGRNAVHPEALVAPDPGTPRAEVRSRLGMPQQSRDCAEGVATDAYTYRAVSPIAAAADRTAAAIRGLAYSILDGATFALWNLVGVPLEEVIQRATAPEPKQHVLTIQYDAAERVAVIRRERAEATPTGTEAGCDPAPPASNADHMAVVGR